MHELNAMIDKRFAATIASLNAGGFFVSVAGITYVDARLTTHVVYGARDYPYGYYCALSGGIIILVTTYFVITYFSFLKNMPWWCKALLPSGIVLLIAFFSLPVFKPEIPHMGFVEWTLQIAFMSCLLCFIRLLPFSTNSLTDHRIARSNRTERAKEYANLWRTITVSLFFGFIALLVPWSNLIWGVPKTFVRSDADIFLVVKHGTLNILLISFYALFVFGESYNKANQAADLILLIKNPSWTRAR